jgi:hypothetical protein
MDRTLSATRRTVFETNRTLFGPDQTVFETSSTPGPSSRTLFPSRESQCAPLRRGRFTLLSAVQTVLEFLGAGDSVDDVLAEYPTLTREDVQACLDSAARVMGGVAMAEA